MRNVCSLRPPPRRSQVGARLVVLNLSQQTDASDLLGGFRPVEARDAIAPLLPTFGELVRRTWPRGSNAEFLGRVARLASKSKWPSLIAAFKGALHKVGGGCQAQRVVKGPFITGTGSYLWLQNEARVSYRACQIGRNNWHHVSLMFDMCIDGTLC
jgi:hypothetical protein